MATYTFNNSSGVVFLLLLLLARVSLCSVIHFFEIKPWSPPCSLFPFQNKASSFISLWFLFVAFCCISMTSFCNVSPCTVFWRVCLMLHATGWFSRRAGGFGKTIPAFEHLWGKILKFYAFPAAPSFLIKMASIWNRLQSPTKKKRNGLSSFGEIWDNNLTILLLVCPDLDSAG